MQTIANIDAMMTGRGLLRSASDVGVRTGRLSSGMRAMLGSTENRLSATHDNLLNSVENASAARSRIRDADYATETMQLACSQILQQAGMAMAAQANSRPNQALLLLRA